MTMCPACARIIHGRYVSIIEREHRFMHERGACHCGVRFPHLQEPHVVEHNTGVAASNQGPTAYGQTYADRPCDSSKTPTESSGSSPTESNGRSAAGSMGSAKDLETSGRATPPFRMFQFSPGAAEFTPSWSHVHRQDPNESPSSSRAHDDKGKGKETQELRQTSKSKGSGQGQYHHEHPPAVIQDTPTLPPLFEHHEEGDGSGFSISVRSRSLYGAEWSHDHGELHRAGRCSCDITFERYPGQYMNLLQEAIDEIGDQTDPNVTGGENITTNVDPTTVAFEGRNTSDKGDNDGSAGGSGSGNGGGGETSTGIDVNVNIKFSRGDDTNPTTATVPGPSTANTLGAPQVRHELPAGNPSHFSSRRRRRAAARARAQARAQVQAQAQAQPTTSSTGWQYAPHELNAPYDGEPMRWACAPFDTTNMQSASEGHISREENLEDIRNHPVDCQAIAYNQTSTPIAGLPIGAGPEGDSHMPPFEECELCYPKIPRGRRPASH